MKTTMTTLKKIQDVRQAPPMHWVGDGFPVRSMFSYEDPAETFSPFLLLDYAAPMEIQPSKEPRGVGEHPHRGFETVTIVYQGEVEHRDSAGNKGKIGPGDVQWMTAARGVVHEEMHSREFARTGGTMQMAQLWVNLPSKHKMSAPKYQDLMKSEIPVASLADGAGSVRVIAGEFQGAKGPAKTFTPVNLWDLSLAKGGTTSFTLTEGHTALLLVVAGEVKVNGSKPVGHSQLIVLDRKGEGVSIEAAQDSKVLLMSGEPIQEPVVGYGPFVMNTQLEIRQALRDYQMGRMGELS